MEKRILATAKIILVVLISFLLAGCSNDSRIEGVGSEAYARGLEFVEYLEQNSMIGQREGEEKLNQIAKENAPDSEQLFEDVLYVLWVYHNLKSVPSAEDEMNKRRAKAGLSSTISEEYQTIRKKIEDARTQADLWEIWNAYSRSEEGAQI